MFGKYVQVLRRPGALRFTSAGFLARMQISMAGLGAVLLLSAERGSFAIAGAVAALYALSSAVVGPQISRLIDAIGQRRVALIQLAVHVPTIAAMVVITLTTDLNWPNYLLAVLAGASQPMVGAMVRARWASLLHGSALLRTAFAWESMVDEAVFILGPPLVTVAALSVTPSAGILLATALLAIGTVLFLAQRSTEPRPAGRRHAKGARPAIMLPGVFGVAAIFVMLGGIFGSFEVTTVAFTKEAGVPGAAGAILAVYAVGSLLAGLVFGAQTMRSPLSKQFLAALVLLAVVTFPLPFLPTVLLVGIGLFVAGLACSPALIAGAALVERIVPGGRITESIAWIFSGITVGIALASPLAGVIIDRYGAAPAYWVTSGSAVLAMLIAIAVFRSMRRADAAAAGAADVVAAGSPAGDPLAR